MTSAGSEGIEVRAGDRRGAARELADVLARVAQDVGTPLTAVAATARVRRALGPWLGRRVVEVRVVSAGSWKVVLSDAVAASEARRHVSDLEAAVGGRGGRPVRLEILARPGGAPEPPPQVRAVSEGEVGPLAARALEEVADAGARRLLERVIAKSRQG